MPHQRWQYHSPREKPKTEDPRADDIATVEAIAAIAREGRGQMSGYADVLGTEGDQLVAEWILLQAQNAWTQG